MTPHPDERKRRLGWRLAWIFTILAIALVVYAFCRIAPPELTRWATVGFC